MRNWQLIPLLILCALAGCTKTQRSDDVRVSSAIEQRLNKTAHWDKHGAKDAEVEHQIGCLLQQELTADAAVQIALLNNPRIQAIFEEIGVSQAELIEAGLFSNPVFDLFIRYPDRKGATTNVEYSVTASFLDLFLVPLRVKVAKTELEQATLRATNEILEVSFEVERTYYELQAAQKKLALTQSILELTSIQKDIASRQKNRDNITCLDSQQMQLLFFEAKLDVAQVNAEIIALKERLNRLLGLHEDIQWALSDEWPAADYQGLPVDRLEAIAFRERLDLQVARFQVLRLGRKLGIHHWWVYTDGRIGITGEKDPDGLNTFGPTFSGEIPVFNYGQAARFRLHAQLRQAKDELAALEIQVLSEVRETHKLLMNTLEVLLDYHTQILPLQNRLVISSEELYNVMGLSIDRLLESKRQELQTLISYTLSLRDYWLQRVQLDRALGGHLCRVFSCEDDPLPWYCCEGAIE